MAFLREIPKVKDPNDNKQLLNYIYALEEQLRYVYANLGAENLIDGAVGANQLQDGCITTEKLSAAAGKDLKIMSQKAVRIIAKEIEQLAEDANGNASIALQTVNGFENRVEDVEQNSAEAVLRAKEAYLKVEAVEGQADYVQYATPTGDIEIGDTWTQVAAPPTTWAEARAKNWSNTKMWGELYYNNVRYFVWDGKQWVPLVDAEEQRRVLTEVQVKAEGALIKVEELAGTTPSVVRSTSAAVDLDGFHLYTGGTFDVESGNFNVDKDGNVKIKGYIEAMSGNIGGWNIAPGNLSSGSGTKHVRLSTEDATYAIWAGAEAGASAPFRVTPDGKVYLTKLYVTDENGNAQANPVNLSGSWWRTNRAVRSMTVSDNTLTITLYDGTSVNFKKADGYGYITGLANGNTITIGGYKLNESGQGEIVDSGAITLTLDTENKKVNFSGGAGFKNFTAANGMDVSALYDSGYGNGYNEGFDGGKEAYQPTSIVRTGYGSDGKSVITKAANSKQDVLTNQTVDATGVYNNGWNECIDNCSYQSEVYTISEHQPASPLYMKGGDSYTSVGTGWVRTARATGMYRIPGKKT